MTRAQHLAWCKARALEYVERGHLIEAMASMGSDLGKHAETEKHVGIQLGVRMMMAGQLQTQAEMRRFIEGFN